MQDYTNYTIKDFMLDESFCRWVVRNTPEDDLYWTEWFKDYPQKRAVALAAKELIQKIHDAHEELSETELKKELLRLSKIRQDFEMYHSQSPSLKRLIVLANVWKYAAIVLIVAGLGIYLSKIQLVKNFIEGSTAYQERTKNKSNVLEEISNEGHVSKVVQLPDSSYVTLSANSRISYPKTFAKDTREVYLSGEAFFEVTKNPSKPFVVYANELITKVLGTSFIIRSYDRDEEVKVVVKTGSVAVYSVNKADEPHAKSAEIRLSPNQKVIFDRSEKQMKRSIVEVPEPIRHKNTPISWNFENAAIIAVFDSLQSNYGIPLNYDKKILQKCHLTAELGNQPLFAKLDLICKAINARYVVVDGQIIISGKGCE